MLKEEYYVDFVPDCDVKRHTNSHIKDMFIFAQPSSHSKIYLPEVNYFSSFKSLVN